MTYLNICLITRILLILLLTSETGACESEWFGSQCQFKCRCVRGQCDVNGACLDGFSCDNGWFGPACQYADLADESTILMNGTSGVNFLKDEREDTCTEVSSNKFLTLNWDTPVPFTWMRIHTDNSSQNSEFQIQFGNQSDTGFKLNCRNLRTSLISQTATDFYCDLDVAIDQVIVSWKNVHSICSIYVSGGRNIALNQSTNQTSTYGSPYTSDEAVNDITRWPSCTHTSVSDPSPQWNMYFSKPAFVNRYVLYNRNQNDCCRKRLTNFILESFASDSNPLLNHNDNQGVKDNYTVLSVGVKKPVSRVQITATYKEQQIEESRNVTILTLCEVQVYGESQCPTGHYGLECNKTCNCAENEDCFVSTGDCPSGCAAGFYREGCQTECPASYHGIDCLKSCGNNCRNQSCDSVSGKCKDGCIIGKQGEFCSQSDDDMSYAVWFSILGIAVIAIVGLATYFYRRRHRKMKDQSADVNSQMLTRETIPNVNEEIPNDAIETRPIDVKTKRSAPKENKQPTAKSETNDAYCNTTPGLQSTAVAIKDLESFMLSHDRNFYQQQFNKIPTNHDVAMTVGESVENKNKNRYKNICAFDHSRVQLKADPWKNHGDYINASFVRGYNDGEKFIASQGPTKNMINDFVRMLWEQKVEKVVMLTNLIEEGKTKCEKYWPDDDKIQFDEIQVQLTTTDVLADYTIRRLQLYKDGEETQKLTQYHFTSWPDKNVPATPWGLVDFEQRVALEPTDRPIVVHCSAGVGRTGTFIGLRNVMREAEEIGQMDFYSTLFKLRQDRVMMIQTLDQYIFLHKAAQVAQLCIGTTLTEDATEERIKTLEMKSLQGETNMKIEFQAICKVCEDMTKNQIEPEEQKEEENVYQNNDSPNHENKNRFQDIVPNKIYRPFLATEDKGTDNYINAVLVPSFTKHNQNILTQLPMPETVTDFWRLVTQYKVSMIVAFEVDSFKSDLTVANYLPTNTEEPICCQTFNIMTKSSKAGNSWTEMKLSVSEKNLDSSSASITRSSNVTHFSCSTTDVDPKKLLTLLKYLRSNRSAGQGRTLYMCRNGAAFSGLVCVLSLLLDRMEHDRRLTVPLVVGAIKAIRPQAIPTLDQYSLLYQVLHRYVETTNSYTNFGVQPSNDCQPQSTLKLEVTETEEDETNVYANNPSNC